MISEPYGSDRCVCGAKKNSLRHTWDCTSSGVIKQSKPASLVQEDLLFRLALEMVKQRPALTAVYDREAWDLAQQVVDRNRTRTRTQCPDTGEK